MMDSFIIKDGKKMRRGYTTGSCAAAASKAAAIMLLGDTVLETVYLMTPRGIGLNLTVHEIQRGENYVSCGIVKDSGGLKVTISTPAGVEIAKKTFNPRLGIVGGLSILGTTGIVEPMSDEAVVETIRTELSMRAASGKTVVLFTPGNYGADYIKNELHIDPEIAVTTSNFIGDAFALAAEFGFRGALLVGHIGKLIKVAGGIFNTHSRYGDCRMEIFASHAGMCGASADVVRRIMDSAMTDDMLAILEEAGLQQTVMDSVMSRMHFHLTHRPVGNMTVGAATFSNVHGILGKTADADQLLEQIRKEY